MLIASTLSLIIIHMLLKLSNNFKKIHQRISKDTSDLQKFINGFPKITSDLKKF